MLLLTNTQLPFELIRVVIALAGTIVATYYDLFNNKNIPELLLYAFIAIAFIVNIAAFDSLISTYAIISTIIIFTATYLLYKIGQIGGADVFIMSSITLLIPVQPKLFLLNSTPGFLSLPFILNVILASGITFMAYMLIRSFPVAYKYVKKKNAFNKRQLLGAIALLISFTFFSIIASSSLFLPSSLYLFLSAVVLASIYFTLFREAINDSMVKWVHVKDIEQEDIMAVDKMNKKLILQYSLSRLVDAKMLKRISKSHNKFAIYKELPPYIPHLLFGLIISLLFGNIVIALTNMNMIY